MNISIKQSALNCVPLISASLLALLVSACGKSDLRTHQQLRKHAPQSSKDVGVLVQGVSEQEVTQVLDQNPEAKARIINSRHGLYEIYNMNSQALKAEWPAAKVVENQFFKTFENKIQPTLAEKMEILADPPPSSGTVNTGGEKLEQCVEDPKSPEAVLEVVSSTEDISDKIMDLGGEFTLSSKKSSAHPDHPSKLKVGWLVMAPTGSKLGQQVFFAESMNYKPDAYGMYQMMMVIQDERKVCAGTNFEVIVTGNKDFVGNDVNVDEILKQFDRKTFTHLPEMKADQAQAINSGEGVLIAVIDTGVNYNHAALVKNIWVNKKEIPGNKIDDDGNGQIDDIVGYDFANDDGSPYDDQGHGSHVAGLAASSFFGLAPNAQIMSLKGLSPAGGDIASIVGAIYYAVDNGAQVLNMSFGNYGPPHPSMVEVMDYAESKDVVVLAAAGNGHPTLGTGLNTDQIANFPSALPHDNIIAVAAKDSTNLLAPYSNYGTQTVDIAAPGGNAPKDVIVSSFLDNPDEIAFMGMSGTSMATPIVSGVAALMLSANPTLKSADVKKILMTTGPQVSGLDKLVQSGRYVDALQAVQAAKNALPNEVPGELASN